ncbi:hypothetical protein GUJ93_ZPchr0010g10418 [Zizania palustris]|uniref:Uncharacterized protein n=1 Tax=Zizania palustris TaxID=103762 RepID=A0A8J5WD64_ZIZPA|nr:hypothetical protein GUJ93_ZPchr0010g10418 [Zizania palustris]
MLNKPELLLKRTGGRCGASVAMARFGATSVDRDVVAASVDLDAVVASVRCQQGCGAAGVDLVMPVWRGMRCDWWW